MTRLDDIRVLGVELRQRVKGWCLRQTVTDSIIIRKLLRIFKLLRLLRLLYAVLDSIVLERISRNLKTLDKRIRYVRRLRDNGWYYIGTWILLGQRNRVH